VPAWVRTLVPTGPPDQVREASEAHVAHLRDLAAHGRLRFAGRFVPEHGFLDVFEARDLLEAEATAQASPLVAAGLVAWTLREWEALEIVTGAP
jgi:uncharacterized protein YciI